MEVPGTSCSRNQSRCCPKESAGGWFRSRCGIGLMADVLRALCFLSISAIASCLGDHAGVLTESLMRNAARKNQELRERDRRQFPVQDGNYGCNSASSPVRSWSTKSEELRTKKWLPSTIVISNLPLVCAFQLSRSARATTLSSVAPK